MLKYSMLTVEALVLQNNLLQIKTNPYKDYLGFRKAINTFIANGGVPDGLYQFLKKY